MLPILLDLGFIKIYTYGVFLVLSFFWGAFFLWKNITLTSFKEEEVFDGVFFSLIGGVFFGRLQYVILNFEDFGYNILRFILINGYPGIGGLGFIFGLILFLLIYTSMHKMSFLKLIDYVVPPLFLALAIAKMGALFSGSEIGSQTTFFLSLTYPNLDGARHLTPLYEALTFFAGTFFSYKILRSIRRNRLFEGFNVVFFIWYFSLALVAFDFLQSFRTYISGISSDVLGGGLFLLTSTVYLIYYFRQLIVRGTQRVFSFSKQKK